MTDSPDPGTEDMQEPAEPAGRLSIEYVDLGALLERQTPGNPKDHDIPGIIEAYRRHGFADALLLDGRTGLVVGGHGRLEALEVMRHEGDDSPARIDATTVRNASGEVISSSWLVPVQVGWSSKDDADARDMVVRINRLTERGGWNPAALTAFDVGDLLGELWEPSELDDLFGDDRLVDGPEGADNEHADLPPARQGEPPPPRTAQGINEIVLLFQTDHHSEAQRHLTHLSHAWGEKVNSMVVLRALREAAERAG